MLEFASGGAQVRLTQSLAIIEYLDEVHPTASFPLLPKDPILRARVRQVSEPIFVCKHTETHRHSQTPKNALKH